MIEIKDLKCPICGAVMSSTSFNIDYNLSDSHGTIYKVTYKCRRCNTFLTTYSPMKKEGIICDV